MFLRYVFLLVRAIFEVPVIEKSVGANVLWLRCTRLDHGN